MYYKIIKANANSKTIGKFKENLEDIFFSSINVFLHGNERMYSSQFVIILLNIEE